MAAILLASRRSMLPGQSKGVARIMALTRRDVLRLGAVAAANASLVGCRSLAHHDARRKGARIMDAVAIEESTVIGKEGAYRVGKSTTGRWWLLRPDGTPFVYRGCCAVCRGNPADGGNAYWKHTRKTYGEDDQAFFRDSVRVLGDLDFNAFGNWNYIWSPGAPYETYGWPYVVNFHAREAYRPATLPWTNHVDVFDPRWRRAYEDRCARECPRHRDNPNCLGYFTDNEPFWTQPKPEHVWGRTPLRGPTLLQHYLALNPARAGHQAAWDWVLARHGNSVSQLAGDWGADFASPGELAEQTAAKKAINTPAYGRDHEAFTAHYARTYFRETGAPIRRHDPNHLILGNRHAGSWGAHGRIVLESYDPRYVDVISANCYGSNFYERLEGYYQHAKLPILNGEYNWVGFVNWDKYTSGEPFTAEELERNARIAVANTETAFTHPSLIGYTWFKWYSGGQPPQMACGVVTDDGQVQTWNAALFKHIHARLERIRAGKLEPAGM